MRIKNLLLLVLLLMSSVLIPGCGLSNTKEEVSVYYLNFKPEAAKIWEEIAEEYTKETGIPVKILTAANGNYEQTLKSEIAKRDAPTLFQINGPVGYQTWKNYCADLSGTNLYSWLLDKNLAVSDGNTVGAIPYVVEGYGIIYNQKIMDKYFKLPTKATTATSMKDVNNFETLKAVVEDMTLHTAELGIKGVFASTSFSSGEDWRWQTHLANLPVYYEFKDKGVADTPTLDFKYGTNYQNIFDLYINNSVTPRTELHTKKVDDSMKEFALGECAMVQNGNWAWGQISSVSGNTVNAEDCKFLPIYTGVTGEQSQGLCIGTENFICVNSMASEAQQKAAIDFIEWVYSSTKGKDYVTNKLGFISPFNTFSESEQPTDPLAKEIITYMNDSSLTSVSWNFTAFPSQQFKDALGSKLLDYSKGDCEFTAVTKFVKEQWAKEKE